MLLAMNLLLLDKTKAAYLGLAVGDALGATVEFMTPNEIKLTHTVHKNITGGGWLRLKPGRVTDDTEMSLALGNALLSSNKVEATSIAEAFSEWMRSKPVDIGNTVRRGIMYYRKQGKISVPKEDFNAGNGACMRSLPIAIATLGCDQDSVIAASRIQSHITHHSDISDAGTEHIIELIQMALAHCTMNEMEQYSYAFVDKNPQYRFNIKKINNPSGFIVETLQVVLQSFYSTDDFESCLINVVNRGGDADTTGAIAGMLAGAYYGMDCIPKRWLNKLNQQVMQQCLTQAEELLALAPIRIATLPDDCPHSQNTNELIV